MYRRPFFAPYRAADVTGYHNRCTVSVLLRPIERQLSVDITTYVRVSVLLRHIERRLSLDCIAETDFKSNRAVVFRDTANSAKALQKFPVSVFNECYWVGNLL